MSPPGQGVEIRDWDHEWPQYIVLFTHLMEVEGVKELLLQKGYVEVWRDGWAWEGEGKRKGGIRVWQYLS
jgi:GPI mannosyltransferase 3